MTNYLKCLTLEKTIHTIGEIDWYIKQIGFIKFIRTKGMYLSNISCSFDIETTSFYNNNEKQAIMYEWSFCINGVCIIGRTWDEFLLLINKLINRYKLDENKHLIIYVHNLSYEFQFIRKLFIWKKVFSLDERKPIQAITMDGIEFRCSYMLSGYSLANLSKQLTKYKVEKLVGDLDYSLIRHSNTELTEKELGYCINDVLVVVAYIQETIEREGNITKIPLTKTGYVRNYTRNNCMYNGDTNKYKNFRKIISALTIEPEEYILCKQAFAGGFTHANPLYSGEIMRNVDSFDFTSSYPYVIMSEKFPMSKGQSIRVDSKEQFETYIKNYCCIFSVRIENITSIVEFENYISSSHCRKLKNYYENNGRIVSAESLEITLTEQDYFIIKNMYKWKKFIIYKFYIYKKDYLPKNFILSMLDLYQNKTKLKGIAGKEAEYMRSKEDINSEFGMMVTDICRDEILYEGEWDKSETDIEKSIDKYNRSKKRFLSYVWGIYVTAYARRNLFTGIFEFKNDYLYSDTDSIKVINIDKHKTYIDKYNKIVRKKLELACLHHNINPEVTRPKNNKGKVKELGVWEWEKEDNELHSYKRFKTLGAKRYMIEFYNGEYSLTVSGLNKKVAIPYMLNKYNDIFEAFNDGLIIPKGFSGRKTHTYIDYEQRGIIKDYKGIYYEYGELSSVHIEDSDYSLKLSEAYVDFLLNIKHVSK